MIADEKYYMGIMIQRDNQSQRMYLHDVITEKATLSFTTEPTAQDGEGIRDKGHLFITSILQNALIVKYQNDPSVKEDTQQEKAKNNIENLGRKNGESKPSRL